MVSEKDFIQKTKIIREHSLKALYEGSKKISSKVNTISEDKVVMKLVNFRKEQDMQRFHDPIFFLGWVSLEGSV